MIYHLFKVRSSAVAVILTIEFSSVLPSLRSKHPLLSTLIAGNGPSWNARPRHEQCRASDRYIEGYGGIASFYHRAKWRWHYATRNSGRRPQCCVCYQCSGQVVGYSSTATGESHAFITGPNGVGMTDLGNCPEIPSATPVVSMMPRG